MSKDKRTAHLAGIAYLAVVISGIFSLMYVPSTLIVWADENKTFINIEAHQTLFRSGILAYVLCYLSFFVLPIFLYKLLSPIHSQYAKLMVVLAWISVPIAFVNVQNLYNVLSLFKKSEITDQISAQTMLYLRQYDNGNLLLSVFSGLWLLPFGYLVFKSGFLPKFLGVLLMIGCFGYLINFVGDTMVQDYGKIGIAKWIQMPASLGEIGTCLWLLIIGVIKKKNEL